MARSQKIEIAKEFIGHVWKLSYGWRFFITKAAAIGVAICWIILALCIGVMDILSYFDAIPENNRVSNDWRWSYLIGPAFLVYVLLAIWYDFKEDYDLRQRQKQKELERLLVRQHYDNENRTVFK